MKSKRFIEVAEPDVGTRKGFIRDLHLRRGMLDIHTDLHMFVSDISLGIAPYRRCQGVEVTWEGDAESIKSARLILVALARHRRYSDDELLFDVIRRVAKSLAHDGRAIYELLADARGELKVISFSPDRLRKWFSFWIQILPFEFWLSMKKPIHVVPVRHTWFVDMPASLGGYRGHSKLVNKIKSINRFDGSKWLEYASAEGSGRMLEYASLVDVYYDRLTEKWDWDRRDSSGKVLTEFYYVYKKLGFRLAQSKIRETILDELNVLLKQLGIECKVHCTGFPKPSYIDAVRTDLLEGRVSFEEALKITRADDSA